jgi:hypothetical protein
MKEVNLIDYLNAVPDSRRQAGRRHDHTLILLIVIMSTMSDYIGYRAIGDFIKRNRRDLLTSFRPDKDRLPSFDTVRRVIQNLNFTALSMQFSKWAANYIDIQEGEWVSIDGKAIKGTMSEYGAESQHFINLVSLYCSKQKMILANGRVANSKQSEIPVVKQLITALDITGVTFTLDALHCQKKRQRPL